MKIPKSIKVGPHKYSIQYDHEACVAASARGACMEDSLVIILDPALPASHQKETALHEVIHAVWGQTWMDTTIPDADPKSDGEQIIAELGPRLLSLLQDNPKFVTWLTEKENK